MKKIFRDWYYLKKGLIVGIASGMLLGIAIVPFVEYRFCIRCFASFVIFLGIFGALIGLIKDIINKIKRKHSS